MRIEQLGLTDIRSYRELELAFPIGVSVLVGPNGQGKTNLVEAIHRAATGSSHRVSSDVPLVRQGAERGVIRLAATTDDDRRRTVDLEIAPGQRSRTRVDGHDVRRASEAVGVVRVVIFAPEDVAIVREDPSGRRRFLDELLSQRRPTFAAARSDYLRVLRQRNNLLKQLRSLPRDARANAQATLDVWTEQLVEQAATVVAARIAGVHALSGPADRTYRDVADRPEPVLLTYEASTGEHTIGEPDAGVPDRARLADALRTALQEVAEDEIDRGVTLVGPHRDDLLLTIGELPARNYASQGEAWSLALALKLASYEVLSAVGDRPVVLLDDVFAELDTTRRQRLADRCDSFDQVIVTAAVEADVPLPGTRFDVRLDDGESHIHSRPTAAGGAA
ncbi:MAG: DNA replication/repair protein RecF [Nitriliruptorales bacterium]|nr:DNA replication/repair protein RecF [Nitriliruptorales bacterium]